MGPGKSRRTAANFQRFQHSIWLFCECHLNRVGGDLADGVAGAEFHAGEDGFLAAGEEAAFVAKTVLGDEGSSALPKYAGFGLSGSWGHSPFPATVLRRVNVCV